MENLGEKRLGLIGARSFVGERLTQLLKEEEYRAVSFSRRGGEGNISLAGPVANNVDRIEVWICLAPIWTLPEHFQLLEKYGIKRLVALSSTSRYTKIKSFSPACRDVAVQLKKGEERVLQWAVNKGVDAVILQPTLIYGWGKDKNVSQIARFIRRFGFFPLLGKGEGLRQPLHVDDLAEACLSTLKVTEVKRNKYILSGGEVVPYRTMVERIFIALDRKPRFVKCPLLIFSFAVRLAHILSFHGISTEMAVRMNKDQHFDHSDAAVDLGFRPRPFQPGSSDCM